MTISSRAEAPREPWITHSFRDSSGVFVAASDYVKALPDSIGRWLPGPLFALGTDGFGRSDGRNQLRRFFEVDAKHIAYAALYQLFRQGKVDAKVLKKAMKELEIDPEKPEAVNV